MLSKHMRNRLNHVDDYLDVNKLINEVKSHHNDSYSLRLLLQKVKEHTQSLQAIETELSVKH